MTFSPSTVSTKIWQVFALSLLLGGLFTPVEAAPKWWWWRTPEPVVKPVVATQQSQSLEHWREGDVQTTRGVWPEDRIDFEQQFPQADWWRSWNDPALDTLVQEALNNNPTLLAAESTIKQAQALEKVARASRFPTLQVAPNYSLQKFSSNQFGFNRSTSSTSSTGLSAGSGPIGTPGSIYTFYSTPLTASYEVDLWAENRDRQLSARQNVIAARHDYRNALLQLSSAVATAYVNLLQVDAQLALQQQVETVLAQQVDHYQRRLDVGIGTRNEVASRQQALSSARQQAASWMTTRAVALNQLAVLLGRTPAQMSDLPRGSLDALAIPEALSVGVPSELLLRRPDVLAQEAALEQAAIQVRIARKEFLPKLVLSGQTGFSSIGFKNLFKWDSLANSVGAGLTQRLFTGGVLTGNLAANKATQEQAARQYIAILQTAFQDVEDNLARFKGDYEQFAQGQEVLAAVASQSDTENSRFKAGLSSELTYLPTQVLAIQAQQNLLVNKANILVDVIGVNKAVGGGF